MKEFLQTLPDSSVKELWGKLLSNASMAHTLQSGSQNDIRDGLLRAAMDTRQQILDKIKEEGSENFARLAEKYVAKLAEL